jgi:hypothetical protein
MGNSRLQRASPMVAVENQQGGHSRRDRKGCLSIKIPKLHKIPPEKLRDYDALSNSE